MSCRRARLWIRCRCSAVHDQGGEIVAARSSRGVCVRELLRGPAFWWFQGSGCSTIGSSLESSKAAVR